MTQAAEALIAAFRAMPEYYDWPNDSDDHYYAPSVGHVADVAVQALLAAGLLAPDAATTATWHSEIMRAGLDGLHTNDCWDSEEHKDCRDIVFAVLSGLAEAGYRVVKSHD